jgi:hypothetical protein
MAAHTRLTVDLLSVASGPRASARVAFTSRTDSPRTKAGDDQRLQGVGVSDPGPEQARGELLVGAPQLGPLQRHRPGGGLDGGRAVAVAASGAGALPAL